MNGPARAEGKSNYMRGGATPCEVHREEVDGWVECLMPGGSDCRSISRFRRAWSVSLRIARL